MGTNTLRWNLVKYTLMEHESAEFSQSPYPSRNAQYSTRMVAQSRSPGDLYLQCNISSRSCRIVFEGKTVEEVILEGPGAPTLKRRGPDVVFHAIRYNFEQRKFRIKFNQSGGLSGTEQCSDCMSHLRHFVQITTETAPSCGSNSTSDISEKMTPSSMGKRTKSGGSQNQSEAELSQELFSFSQTQDLENTPIRRFGSSDDFSQSPMCEEDTAGYGYRNFSGGVSHSSPKRPKMDILALGHQRTDFKTQRFETPGRQEKRKTFYTPKSLSQPPAVEDQRVAERFRTNPPPHREPGSQPFRSLVHPPNTPSLFDSPRSIIDRTKVDPIWNEPTPVMTVSRSISTETPPVVTNEMEAQTENYDADVEVKEVWELTEGEMEELMSVAVSEDGGFMAFAERVGRVMGRRGNDPWPISKAPHN